MKILLIDVDSKIPNLALMKISKYYKNLYNEVECPCYKFDSSKCEDLEGVLKNE